MSSNSQRSCVTLVYKLDEDNKEAAARVAQMWSHLYLDGILKLNEWKLETRMDGFGRRYVMLEIGLPPLSSTDETKKNGLLSCAPKTLSLFSKETVEFYKDLWKRHKKDRSTHDQA